MSKTTVVGSAPISFTIASTGQAISVPLSALSFDDTRENIIELVDQSASYNSVLQPWLNYLYKVGTLKAKEKSAPKPAIEIEAKNPGKAGNSIQIEFKDIKITPDPSDSTFTAIITATEIYKLSFDKNSDVFIDKVLVGMDKLVHVKVAGAATETAPKDNKSYKLGGGDDTTTKSSRSIDAEPSGTAFTIEAKNKGKDGNDIKIDISNVNATDKTYTLTATWNPTFEDIKLVDLPRKLQGSQEIIVVTKPKPTGSEFAIPDAGVVVLNGGADKQDAVAAKAIVFFS
jgi:hypothetical protein